MPKTTVATPVQALKSDIERLEAAIASTANQLESQNLLIADYAESLRIVETRTAKYIPQGVVEPLDQLRTILEEGTPEEIEANYQYRLGVAKQALADTQAQSTRLRLQLDNLQQQLVITESELDWMENYQPHVERYRAGFSQPSPEDVKNGKVAAFEADINQRRTHLLRAQAWLS
ncbi:hypothetical protein, partial [Tolypothrix sp. VBCCA 56010]|uniref:hypothetical protein n=1 Tax=Tolypothrix sp. VBCCA 56010 TaxID=3137731 RepID=UPI003D7D48EE